MAQIKQTRISAFKKFEATDEGVTRTVDQLITSTAEAKKWVFPVDYVAPDGGTDFGTKQIGVERLGLLTVNRLVPQSMLPNRVNDIVDGHMTEESRGVHVFTTLDGKRYVCPRDPEHEETHPTIDMIYRDMSDGIYTQYRFIPADGGETEDAFVPIPSDFVLINGEGTKINDDPSAYTRRVDLVIGNPVQPSGSDVSKVLLISDHKLVHGTSGVVAAEYPAAPHPTEPGFGDAIAVPQFTVNATGHITDAGTSFIHLPKTPATLSTAGLVKIGGVDKIRGIGESSDPGTVSPADPDNPYVYVAAADHVHTASTLTLRNSNAPGGTVTYNGSSDVSYDFDWFLKVPHPTAAPDAAGMVLATSGNGSELRATWEKPADIIKPAFVFFKLGAGSITTAQTTLTLADTIESSGLAITTTTVTGMIPGHVYALGYNILLRAGSIYSMNESFELSIVQVTSSGTEISGSAVTGTHVLDQSIGNADANFFSCVNGLLMFRAASNCAGCKFKAIHADGNVTWSLNSTDSVMQLAEVK